MADVATERLKPGSTGSGNGYAAEGIERALQRVHGAEVRRGRQHYLGFYRPARAAESIVVCGPASQSVDVPGVSDHRTLTSRFSCHRFSHSTNICGIDVNHQVGRLLAELREAAKMTQRQVAELMGASQTGVSRLEAGEGDGAEAERFLKAIGTPGAQSLAEKLRVQWRHLPQPSLKHPDLETLIAIERGLTEIQEFLAEGQVPTVLAGQAELLRHSLEEAGRYLLPLHHELVYVGEIGIGKTTAACRQAGLVLHEAKPTDLKGMLLDTGGGRTTLCDVRVESGERFALTIEPIADEEIYKLVAEVCRGIHQRLAGGIPASTADFTPPEEVERALRNMAKLPRPARARKGGPPSPDPAIELARSYSTLNDFIAEFAARLRLWRRSRRTIEYDGVDLQAGRDWLRSTFTAINNGKHDDFSLPARISVAVPFRLIPDAPLDITVIDTRGVDGSAIRPDILARLKDDRAVVLLCSKWGSAPDPSIQNLLTHVSQTNADRSLLNRVAVVALARSGDAMSMRYDSLESPEDVAQGYEIKLGHVEDALQKIGMNGIPAFAFDASADDAGALSGFILKRINGLRKRKAEAALATIASITQMRLNRKEAQALAAMQAVVGNLERFAARHRTLRGARRPAHERLIGAVETLHPRTVWASTRRAGRFWNFDIFQYLGDGAAAEAKIRSSEVIVGLKSIIESDQGNPEFVSAYAFLAQVLTNAAQWEADFVNAVRHHALAIYTEPLSREQQLWDGCDAAYGMNISYREEVAARLRAWFEDNVELREELERRISRAWQTSVVSPLRRASGSEPQLADRQTEPELS